MQAMDTPPVAKQLHSLEDIDSALDRLAARINVDYADRQPLLLCVLNGAIMTMGHLLPKLNIALETGYVHVSRYGGETQGGSLNWHAKPQQDLTGRHVLLIEDIFDEGPTLAALREYCLHAGASSVACLALVNKQHQRKTGQPPEYLGLQVPDQYVIGFGMDVQGWWRNLPGIYTMSESAL